MDLCRVMIVGLSCCVCFFKESEETRSKQHSHSCHTEFIHAVRGKISLCKLKFELKVCGAVCAVLFTCVWDMYHYTVKLKQAIHL